MNSRKLHKDRNHKKISIASDTYYGFLNQEENKAVKTKEKRKTKPR